MPQLPHDHVLDDYCAGLEATSRVKFRRRKRKERQLAWLDGEEVFSPEYYGSPKEVLAFVSSRLPRNVKPARLTNPTTAKLSVIATKPMFTPAITGNLTAAVQQRKTSETIKPAAILEADGRRSKNASRTPGKTAPLPWPPPEAC